MQGGPDGRGQGVFDLVPGECGHGNKAIQGARTILLPLLGSLPAFRTKLATELAELNYR